MFMELASVIVWILILFTAFSNHAYQCPSQNPCLSYHALILYRVGAVIVTFSLNLVYFLFCEIGECSGLVLLLVAAVSFLFFFNNDWIIKIMETSLLRYLCIIFKHYSCMHTSVFISNLASYFLHATSLLFALLLRGYIYPLEWSWLKLNLPISLVFGSTLVLFSTNWFLDILHHLHKPHNYHSDISFACLIYNYY